MESLYPSLAHEDPVDVLRLIRSEQVGAVTFFNLLQYYGSVPKALAALPELAKRGGRKKPIVPCSREDAERELAALKNYGAQLVVYGDAHYPPLLRMIYDAPPALTVLGHIPDWQRPMVSMVGARNASALGCQFAKKLAIEMSKAQVIVVSGLARGIDTAAHQGSLETGTVAVIAGGIDDIYPPQNESLYHAITKHGCIITEQPFGAKPQARSFPARNRIIAGMTQGLIVVEASEKSGSLITAQYAADYGREIFAVPGSPMDPRCTGTNGLLKQGAWLTESAEDVLAQLRMWRVPALRERTCEEIDFLIPPETPEQDSVCAQSSILEKLGPHPVLVDELLEQCQVTPHLLWASLLELELAGKLQRHPGNKVSLLVGAREIA